VDPLKPAQYVRRPQVHAPDARGLDRSELGVFLFTVDQYDRSSRGCGRAPRPSATNDPQSADAAWNRDRP
jgi:hypothetical protein